VKAIQVQSEEEFERLLTVSNDAYRRGGRLLASPPRARRLGADVRPIVTQEKGGINIHPSLRDLLWLSRVARDNVCWAS
jgi:hypothetical protein